MPVNKRNQEKEKRGRPIKVDQEECKMKSAIERFFSWIESCKKYFQDMKSKKYHNEIKEISYPGIVMLAAIIRLDKVLRLDEVLGWILLEIVRTSNKIFN